MSSEVDDSEAPESERQARLITAAEAFARAELAQDSSGHDWSHIERVRRLAMSLAREEGAEIFICELAALLHDIADYKIAGDDATGQARVRHWLDIHDADDATTERIMSIIATMSFAGGERPPMTTLEGRVVQDADRLDAIGAIGVVRAFAYGATRGRAMYDPDIPPRERMSPEDYRSQPSPTINHFYEKLLLLKDRMNTVHARRLAEERHRFMLAFLEQFYAEWEGRA